jgi:hypothetical protein
VQRARSEQLAVEVNGCSSEAADIATGMNTIMRTSSHAAGGLPKEHSFTVAFAVAAIGLAAAAAAALAVPHRPVRPHAC